jgi:hypothetical protein
MLRRVLAQVLVIHSHQIYMLDCCVLPLPQQLPDEKVVQLSSECIDDYPSLTSQLTLLNIGNAEYLADIRRDRMIGALVESKGQLVHYGFFYKRNRMACLLGLPPRAALIGNSFTIPEYRGRGCQGRSVLARALAARQAGFTRIYAETSIDNIASGRGLAKAGMNCLGRMDFVVIGRVLVIRWRRPEGFSLLGFCW